MDGRNNKSLDDQMSVLTAKIDDLIQTCGRLQTENQQLSLEKNELAQSKEELLNRNREAKRKIDKVVERLRGLEAS
jgi:cell division protein ZapB|tara:strand:+ start:1764 stop:1991 length:228 start_codon:yes stop_codon:yes gene_type:complete